MKQSFSISLIVCLLVFLSSGCTTTQPKYHAGGPYYYKCWAGNRIPFRPVDEITVEETELIEINGYPYYEAHFNKDGYIVSFKKRNQGKVEWVDKYYYKNGVFQKRELEELDGKVTIEYYDKEGNIIGK